MTEDRFRTLDGREVVVPEHEAANRWIVTIDDVLNYELDVFDAAHPETPAARECLVPPVPRELAAVLNRTRRDGQP